MPCCYVVPLWNTCKLQSSCFINTSLGICNALGLYLTMPKLCKAPLPGGATEELLLKVHSIFRKYLEQMNKPYPCMDSVVYPEARDIDSRFQNCSYEFIRRSYLWTAGSAHSIDVFQLLFYDRLQDLDKNLDKLSPLPHIRTPWTLRDTHTKIEEAIRQTQSAGRDQLVPALYGEF
jgi:hypothetical protein